MKITLSMLFIACGSLAQAQALKFKNLEELDYCLRENHYNTEYCLTAAEVFAKKNPKQAFAIGQKIRLHYASWVALRFFEPGLGKKPTTAQCADEQLSLAVNSGLALPPDYPGFAQAKNIFNGPCFDALLPAVKKELEASTGGYDITNVCPMMAAKKITVASCAPKAPEPVVAAAPEEKLPVLDRAKLQVGLIKVYKGPEGQKLTIGELPNNAGYYLVRFDGISGSYNGKTLLHKKETAGENVTYWTEVNGKRWNSVVGRMRSGYSDFSSFLPGSTDEISIGYSEGESKSAKALDLTR
jgi:hypothetical protein